MTLTVIGSFVSPYVRKVLACLELKGLDYEVDPITPFFGNDEFTRLSPLRRIPVLIDGDLASVRFRASSAPISTRPMAAMHCCPKARATAPAPAGWRNLPTAGSATCSSGACSTRASSADRCGTKDRTRRGWRSRWQRQPAALDYLEGEVPEDGYLFGALGLADIALASFFVNARYAGFELDAGRWPKLARLRRQRCSHEPMLQKLLGFEAIQLNATIHGRRQALIDAGARLTEKTWGLREPRRGVMAL